MELNNKATSMNEVKIADFTIVFSYSTPVEILVRDYGRVTTKEKFSSTTSKHMNRYCYEPNCEPKDFDKVVELIDNEKFLKAKNLIKKLWEVN